MKDKHTEEKFLDLLETELPNAKPLDTDLLERMLVIQKKAEEMEAKRFSENFYNENDHAYEKFGMTTEMLEGLSLPHEDKPVEKMGNLEQYLLFEEE